MIGIEGVMPVEIYKAAKISRRWALSQNRGKSRGMCGYASIHLARQLENLGIEWDFVEGLVKSLSSKGGLEHCWLVVGGRILDITADQFGKKKFGPICWQSAYRRRGIWVVEETNAPAMIDYFAKIRD